MNTIARLDQRRRAILRETESMRSLCRATLNEQMLRVPHKGKKEPVLRGPYYVLARWEQGKTYSRRVKGEELVQLKENVANYKRFVALCKEYAELTERLGELEREEGAELERLKKGLKSRSNKARKSRG